MTIELNFICNNVLFNLTNKIGVQFSFLVTTTCFVLDVHACNPFVQSSIQTPVVLLQAIADTLYAEEMIL